MTYPETRFQPVLDKMPVFFNGQRTWIPQHVMPVWTELCDTFPIGEPLNVAEIANQLTTLKHYANPARYLRAILTYIEVEWELYGAEKDPGWPRPFTRCGTFRQLRCIIL